VLRAPHAHARIVRIDTASALAAQGVIAVLTAADEAADGIAPLETVPSYGDPRSTPRPALASQIVRHIGEPVVLILAETEAQAHEAAFMVKVDYEDLPALTTRAEATASPAPLVWPHAEGNVG